MPRIKQSFAKVDRLKGIVLERKQAQHITYVALGELLGCSGQAAFNLLKRPSSEWTIGQASRLCEVLGVQFEATVKEG